MRPRQGDRAWASSRAARRETDARTRLRATRRLTQRSRFRVKAGVRAASQGPSLAPLRRDATAEPFPLRPARLLARRKRGRPLRLLDGLGGDTAAGSYGGGDRWHVHESSGGRGERLLSATRSASWRSSGTRCPLPRLLPISAPYCYRAATDSAHNARKGGVFLFAVVRTSSRRKCPDLLLFRAVLR